MTKEFPKLDISVMAAITEELAKAEEELMDTDSRNHIVGIRRLHAEIKQIRHNIETVVSAWEEENKRVIPNKPKWHKGICLAEIKCPKCGGYWHDVDNNVSREEICRKCWNDQIKSDRNSIANLTKKGLEAHARGK